MASTDNCVCIFFNGYQIVPNPMLNISRETQNNGAGTIIGATTKVTLTGKIVNGGFDWSTREDFYTKYLQTNSCARDVKSKGIGIAAKGTDSLMEEERAMRTVFSNNNNIYGESDFRNDNGLGQYIYGGTSIDNNLLSVVANGYTMLEGYAKVMSYSTTPSPNNWTQSIDYTIELEIAEPLTLFINNDDQFLISSATDDISMEPMIEETSPFNASGDAIDQYFNTANGLLGFQNLQGYPTLMNMYYFGHNTRYKITRTVEAVGKHSFNQMSNYLNGYSSTRSNLTRSSPYVKFLDANRTPDTRISNTNSSRLGQGTALKNAQTYVQARLTHYPTNHFLTTWTLCNRVRAISSSDTAGSYRVVETSMAVDPKYHPPLTDDWTADVTVDSSFLMTVKIHGTLKGYETYGWSGFSNNVIFGTSIAGPNNVYYHGVGASYYVWGVTPNYTPANGLGFGYKNNLLGNLEPATFSSYDQFDYNSNNNTHVVGKYENAINGMTWLKGGFYNNDTDNTNIWSNNRKNSTGLDNPYRSPIVNRARLFFAPTAAGRNIGSNPYRFLNNVEAIATRQALLSANPVSYNLPNVETFNPIPINMTESHRMSVGEIDYSFEFNNRPINLIAGSVSESLSVSDNFPTQSIAEVFVIGRRLGPVLQDLGTVTSSSRTVSLEVSLPRVPALAQRLLFPVTAYTAATGIVEQFNPKYLFGNYPSAVIRSYIKEDTQSWNPIEGKLTITKGWVWQRGS